MAARPPSSLSSVPAIQRAPWIGPASGPFEREAEDAARSVVVGSGPARVTPLRGGAAPSGETAGAQSAARAVASGGRSLTEGERGLFEPRFGQDFSGVRIHTGPEVDRAAAGIGARAYTLGQDIAIASGEYDPGARQGRHLMAHELTHTLQQQAPQAVQRQSIPDPSDLWDRATRWGGRQADRAGRAWDRGADLGARAIDEAGKAADKAGDAAEDWWTRGGGDITKISFDGSTVKTHGAVSKSYPAVSGLKARHKNAKGTDYTDPKYQDVPDKGPIPEGSYYLDPGEVQYYKTHGFNPGPWGQYRTRLHESVTTNLWRKATTERTGGFFLHKDGGSDGTAGCIGLDRHSDNKEIHGLIKKNAAQIPVEVTYPAARTAPPARPSGPAAGATLQRLQRLPIGGAGLIQRQGGDESETAAKEPEPHYLITAGIARIDADAAALNGKPFPGDYYDTLARHLFGKILRENGRDYGAAFSTLDDLQWGSLGSGLRKHYETVVGTDSANGWDKFRHFVFTAYLQYKSSGFLAPEAFTYGKEMFDEAEGWVGKDPEGYSVPDIRADNKGEAFGEEMAVREWQERIDRANRRLNRGLKRLEDALLDPRTWGVY